MDLVGSWDRSVFDVRGRIESGRPGASSILLGIAFGDSLLSNARKLSKADALTPVLAGLRFSLHVTLGRCQMQLNDVLRIAEGSIIELGRRSNEPIEIHVNGQFVCEGHVARCGERYGISAIGPSAAGTEELEQ